MSEPKRSFFDWIDVIAEKSAKITCYLVFVIMLITTADVIARYVFNQPLVWGWLLNRQLFGDEETRLIEQLNPAPVRDIPVMIGGGGEKKTLRYTAEFADIWHGFGDADVIRHKNSVLDQHCADIGRDPAEIERSSGADPKKIDELADSLYEAGSRLITIGFDGSKGYDMALLEEWLAWRDEKNAA